MLFAYIRLRVSLVNITVIIMQMSHLTGRVGNSQVLLEQFPTSDPLIYRCMTSPERGGTLRFRVNDINEAKFPLNIKPV